jgi:hypothetical protein
MNIFVLDENPRRAARCLCDAHVVKMCLESCQLLCTDDLVRGETRPYRPTHVNHPCRKSLANAANRRWLIRHLEALLDEYEYRYGRVHACRALYEEFWAAEGRGRGDFAATAFANCTRPEFAGLPVVEAYRRYYRTKRETLKRFTYRRRRMPRWLSGGAAASIKKTG